MLMIAIFTCKYGIKNFKDRQTDRIYFNMAFPQLQRIGFQESHAKNCFSTHVPLPHQVRYMYAPNVFPQGSISHIVDREKISKFNHISCMGRGRFRKINPYPTLYNSSQKIGQSHCMNYLRNTIKPFMYSYARFQQRYFNQSNSSEREFIRIPWQP